jgi:hypothetical protein
VIITLKRRRPLVWQRLNRVRQAAPRQSKPRKPGFFEEFEQMLGFYADTVVRAYREP